MDEHRTKAERVAGFMRAHDCGALLLSRRDNFSWYACGGENHVAMATEYGAASLLVTEQACFAITTNIEAERIAHEELAGLNIEVRSHAWHDAAGRAALMKELAGGARRLSDDGTPDTEPLPPDFVTLRYDLTEAELKRFRLLGADCGEAIGETCHGIVPGETEREIAGRLADACLARGVTPSVILVAADERCERYRHPLYKNNPIERYAMVVLCGRRHGLVCSTTRMVHFGSLPDEMRRKYDAVTAVDAVLNAHTRPGAVVGDILAKGIAEYARWGFGDEWRLHHQGGPTGYREREYVAMPGERRTVRPNQPFAWNPSVTGVKSEDTILAGADGPEVVSMTEGWPTVTCRANGLALERPDILIQ